MLDDIFILGLIFIYVYELDLGITLVHINENLRQKSESLEEKVIKWNKKVVPFYIEKINSSVEIPEKLKPIIIRMIHIDRTIRPTAVELKELISTKDIFN